MAKARRKKGREPVEGEDTPRARTTPEVCPICGTIREAITFPDDMSAHLQSHAPGAVCQYCDGKEKGWRLDLDGAIHFRPDVSLFYCSNCGRYTPPLL
jgi:hypothetical protein